MTALEYESQIPDGAKKYADEYFPKMITGLYENQDDPALYGLEKERGEITFGPLHPVYSFTDTFSGVEPANLWISTPGDLVPV
jgi:hypothetical protein